MWIRIGLTVVLLLGGWSLSGPPAYASCIVDTASYNYPDGTPIHDDKCDATGAKKGASSITSLGTNTAAAPSNAEGSQGSFSFDLNGNARVTPGTLLFGEDSTNNLMMVGWGATRITTFSSVTSATSSTTQILFTGPVRFMGQITNATSETKALTVDIYGNWTNSTTGGIAICRITLPSTATVTHLEDVCPITTPDFSYYFYTVVTYTSASAAPFTLYAMQ